MNQHQPDRSPAPGHAPCSRRDAVRRVAAGGIALGAAVALTQRPARAQGSQDSAATEAAARHAIDAINQALATGEMDLLEDAFAPTYVNHTPHRSLTTGRLLSPDLAGLTAGVSQLRGIVPDAVFIVEEVIAAGDRAAVRGRFHGTLEPTVDGGTQATNLDVGGVAVARIADGLVVESWAYGEATGLPGAGLRSTPEGVDAGAAEPDVAAGRGEVRAVSDFEAVSLEGVGTLVLEQGDTESLTITAEPHVLARIETVVEAGTLFIRPVESFETDQPIRYDLTLMALTRLAVAGAGQVEAAQLTADELTIELSGSAMVAIDSLAATALDLVAGGSAELTLAGTVDQQTVHLSEASHYTAPNLASRVAAVTVEAAAQATVAVSEELEAEVGGAGSISYLGDPRVSQLITEAGSLTKVG